MPELQTELQPLLQIDEHTIRHAGFERMGRRHITSIALKQAFYEQLTRARTHVSFRSRQNEPARKAYLAMTGREFEGINARQRWANWRVIPRNLTTRAPAGPVRALDLCCGVGHSTEVLAYYLAPGSRILGLEYNPEFVAIARFREYEHASGKKARVRFRAQSVLETFRDTEGDIIADESIDLVNSCGAVAHHFDPQTTRKLSLEVARVLKRGGLAMIDSGRAGTDRETLIELFDGLGFEAVHEARSCFLDRALQICFRKWR